MPDLSECALQLSGTVARHEPTSDNWKRLTEILGAHYVNGLMTILYVDRDRSLVQRVYTSNAKDYSIGGTKQLMGSKWARQVIDEGRCLIASTPEEMEAAFADHQILSALGCTKAMNIPLRQGINITWTVNLLRGNDDYTFAECEAVKEQIQAWFHELYPGSNLPQRT